MNILITCFVETVMSRATADLCSSDLINTELRVLVQDSFPGNPYQSSVTSSSFLVSNKMKYVSICLKKLLQINDKEYESRNAEIYIILMLDIENR